MRTDFSEFFDLGGTNWLNTAHQGALPQKAAIAAKQAVNWKLQPSKLSSERFDSVPARLRRGISNLINAPESEIALANSASYGLHLIANAFPWRNGDEVLVMTTDFPSDILPWLMLEERFGVKVCYLHPAGRVIAPDELRMAITPKTRLLCVTWVHSFSGHVTDLDALGEICRANDIRFVVNGSQAIGARPLDVSNHPVDAITTVGFKWLCGPYGTGFCWLSPRLMDQLQRIKAYWLSMLSADDLVGELGELAVGPINTAADYDVFGTANFFNFTAFAEAVELLLEIGLQNIAAHNQSLVQLFVDLCQSSSFQLISPSENSERRSSLVLITHENRSRIDTLKHDLDAAGIHTAMRAGALRFSPHLYNSPAQITAATDLIRNA